MAHTENMPAIYTHYAVANALFNTLPTNVKTDISPRLPLYFFGSQGADFCFFYYVFGKRSPNLGSYLHRANNGEVFRLLKSFSERSKNLYAYALGYITHYAADVVFHPYVYATAGNSYPKHSRLESALDVYFKPRLKYLPRENLFQKPSLDEITELYILYASIAKKSGFPPLIKQNFERAIFLFNASPPTSSTLFRGEKRAYLNFACNTEKRVWAYPADQSIRRHDNAEELFKKAFLFAQNLADIFCFSVERHTPLPTDLFQKNFLTGL